MDQRSDDSEMLSSEREAEARNILVVDHPPFQVFEMELHLPKLEWLWNSMCACRTLFSDLTRGDFNNFMALVTNHDSYWLDVRKDGKSIGVIYFTDLHLVTECYAHIVFFDRNLGEKTELCKSVIKWAFAKFRVQRISAAIPEIYFATTVLAKKAGFKKEGVRRQVYLMGGKWVNEVMLGIIRGDVDGWQH